MLVHFRNEDTYRLFLTRYGSFPMNAGVNSQNFPNKPFEIMQISSTRYFIRQERKTITITLAEFMAWLERLS